LLTCATCQPSRLFEFPAQPRSTTDTSPLLVCCPNHVQPIGMLIISARASDASYGSPTARRRSRHYWAVRRGLQRGGMCQQLQRNQRTNTSCLAPRISLFYFVCFVTTVRCNAHLGPPGSSVTVRVLFNLSLSTSSTIHTTKYMALHLRELL
jgi:hypothetical protein